MEVTIQMKTHSKIFQEKTVPMASFVEQKVHSISKKVYIYIVIINENCDSISITNTQVWSLLNFVMKFRNKFFAECPF